MRKGREALGKEVKEVDKDEGFPGEQGGIHGLGDEGATERGRRQNREQ